MRLAHRRSSGSMMQLIQDATEKRCRKQNEKMDAIVSTRRYEQKNGAEGILAANHTECSLDPTKETNPSDTADLGKQQGKFIKKSPRERTVLGSREI